MKLPGLLVATLLLASAAHAQTTDTSLGAQAEKARRDRAERRARAAGQVKSFSNDDLKAGSGSSSATTSTGGSADATKADAPRTDKQEKTDDQVRSEKRAEIQKKIDAARDRMVEVDKVMADAQKEAGDITNYTYGSRRAALQKVLEDGQAEKAKAQQAIDDLQEEARRIGVSVSR